MINLFWMVVLLHDRNVQHADISLGVNIVTTNEMSACCTFLSWSNTTIQNKFITVFKIFDYKNLLNFYQAFSCHESYSFSIPIILYCIATPHYWFCSTITLLTIVLHVYVTGQIWFQVNFHVTSILSCLSIFFIP